MDYRSWLRSLKSRIKPEVKTQAREFIIYRPDGALSLIYITAFESDARAILEADGSLVTVIESRFGKMA